MAARKSFLGPPPNRPELDRLLRETENAHVTDDQVREQRVSFAYGNAPESTRITKESVRDAAKSLRLIPK